MKFTLGSLGGSLANPFSVIYSGPSANGLVVPIPMNAHNLLMEIISFGGYSTSGFSAGAGGTYAATRVRVFPGKSVVLTYDGSNGAFLQASYDSGVAIAKAFNAFDPSLFGVQSSVGAGTGDVVHLGGNGTFGNSISGWAGGGAGGPISAGQNASFTTPGQGGGAPAGAGGAFDVYGSTYGGGSGSIGYTPDAVNYGHGGIGMIRLNWS